MFDVLACTVSGHLTPLRTLVDASISRKVQPAAALQQQQHQPLLYAGGGSPGTQLLISVQQLLAATAAETGCFTEAAAQSQTAEQAQRSQQQSSQQGQESWALQLPLPWPPGSEQVHLVGFVAQKRR